jgi:hypothetical protein
MSIEEQYNQCRQWRDWLYEAGYDVFFTYIDAPEPFDREWRVCDGDGEQIATFDIDGCGASWHGPEDLWLKVIAPKVGVTAPAEDACDVCGKSETQRGNRFLEGLRGPVHARCARNELPTASLYS